MYLHLRALLQALRDHQDQIVLNYFCLAALSWQNWVKFRQVLMSAVFISMAVLLAVLTVSAYTLTVVLYLLYPNYFDHGQPMVASMSWLWMQGHVLYPNWTTGDVYSSVYGPLVFLINGMTLLLNPSIFASKLPGTLSLGAALVATSVLFLRTTGNRLTSLFLLASAVMLFVPFGVSAYWNRPEPFLILVSVLALLVAFSQSSLVSAVGIGVLAGVATGLKLHGVIYTVPAAAIALARVETLRRRFILAIVGSVSAGATAIFPYFEKDVSIAGHLRFLRVALNSGWNPSILIGNLLFSFILLAPIIVIWIRRKPALSLADRWLLMALGFSVAIVSVIGSKLGGGSYYLLPLIPICIYGVAVICTTSKPEAKNIAALIFVSLLLAYGPNLLLNLRPLYFDQVAASSEREKIAELKHYLHSYPDAQIGVSDDEHYSSYFYRVLSVWNGRPQHVDFSLWMDLAHAGVAEEHIVRFIKGCAVPTWILPLGAPFRQTNWYNRLPMLSESFRQTFSTNYRLIETGKAYQVWQCNANPPIE